MKKLINLRSVPFIATLAAAAILATTTWQTVVLARQNQELRTTIASTRTASVAAANSAQPSAAPSPASLAGAAGKVTGATAIAEEQAALARAQARVEKSAAKLGLKPDDEVKSYGRIETLATDSLEFIAMLTAFTNAPNKPDGSELDMENVMGVLAGWVGKSDVITSLESEPKKIARLYALALQQAFKLDAPTTARLQPAIQAEFEKLAAQRLTRPQRPEEDQSAWYRNRGNALHEAAARIQPLIPDAARKPFLVEQVLHLGTGMRTTTQPKTDQEKGVVSMGFELPGLRGGK